MPGHTPQLLQVPLQAHFLKQSPGFFQIGLRLDPIKGVKPAAGLKQVIDAGIPADELVVFKYEDEGVSTLEDGLYVLEDNLKDDAFADKMARFVKASMKGWAWARENSDEAAMIVLDNDATGAQTEKHQKRMMGEINKLTEGSDGSLDPDDYQRTVETLLKGGSDPVITKEPEGAWTDKITKMAM